MTRLKLIVVCMGFAGVALIVWPGTSAETKPKVEGNKEKKVRRLLEASGAGSLGKQVMDAMLDNFKNQKGLPSGFVQKVKELAKPDDLVELSVPIYLKHLGEEDIDAAVAFYEAPAGKHFVKAMPVITKECMEAGKKWGIDLAKKALKSIQEDKDDDGEQEEEKK